MIGAIPIWWPFVRTLWHDFNGALREEGGLLGSKPSPRQLERIRAERAQHEEGLESEPLVRARDVRRPKLRANAPAPRRDAGNTRPRGFR